MTQHLINLINPDETYIGTSLSLCIASIINGDINPEKVIGIESSTRISNDEELDQVIEEYKKTYWIENPDLAERYAREIYHHKIFYQPRLEHNYCIHGVRALWINATGMKNIKIGNKKSILNRLKGASK
jgi:hypothetical protein